jgi:monoterpene epsilon-lactone hydrolase
MPGIRTRLTRMALRAVIKRECHERETTVRHLRRVLAAPPLLERVPVGASLASMNPAPGLPATRISSRDPDYTVLYFHGGAFVAGETPIYHAMAGYMARKLPGEVYLLQYRLAPEHPYPAALEDCLSAYRALLDKGVDPDKLILAGDSAGGNLTLATLLRARDEGLPLPRCAVTFSPSTDATCQLPSIDGNDPSDAMLTASMVRQAAGVYLNGQDPRTPYASPLHGDYQGLPPLFFTVSENECLRDDCYAAVNKAREAGVSADVITRPGMPHVWPIFYPLIPEAGKDLKRAVDFMREPG